MKNRDWPYWVVQNLRVKKRKQVRAALKAVSELKCGCVYTPAYKYIVSAYESLEAAKDLMSVKRWKK